MTDVILRTSYNDVIGVFFFAVGSDVLWHHNLKEYMTTVVVAQTKSFVEQLAVTTSIGS